MSDLFENPLSINLASASSLVESGLFSQYQAASICDYRQSSGDILSLTELLSVDGIGADFAERVSPFISLEGNLGKSSGSNRIFCGDVRSRAALKPSFDGSVPWSFGVRYSSKVGERLSAGLAFSSGHPSGSWQVTSTLASGRVLPCGAEWVWEACPLSAPWRDVRQDSVLRHRCLQTIPLPAWRSVALRKECQYRRDWLCRDYGRQGLHRKLSD